MGQPFALVMTGQNDLELVTAEAAHTAHVADRRRQAFGNLL